MNKKVFQKGFGFLLSRFFVVGTILLCLMIVIEGFSRENWYMIVIGILSSIVLIFEMGYMLYFIHFQDDKIYTKGDLLYPKTDRIQYKAEIFYSDIKDIKIVYSSQNSKNKNSSGLRGNYHYPKTYFEFILKNDKKERLLILNHSKNQRKEMIAIINEKTGLNLDYDIMKTESHPPNEKVVNWFKRKKRKKSIKKRN